MKEKMIILFCGILNFLFLVLFIYLNYLFLKHELTYYCNSHYLHTIKIKSINNYLY